MILFTSLEYAFDFVMFSFPISFISILIIQSYTIYKKCNLNLLNINTFKVKYIKSLFRSGSGIFLAQTSGEIALHADKFIISSILGVSALAPYNLAYLITSRISDLGSLIGSVTYPRILKHLNINHRNAINFYKKTMLITMSLGIIGILLISLLDSMFIKWWVGEQTAGIVLPLILPFMIGAFLGLPSWINGNILIGLDKTYTVALTVLLGAFISLTLCILLTTKYGLSGAVLSWSIGYTSISILQIIIIKKYIIKNIKS